MVGQLFVVGVDRIVPQDRDIDPKWVVVDHTVYECRTETRARRGAQSVMFSFEIRLEELPAQLERDIEPLDRRARTIGSLGRARASSRRATAFSRSARNDWAFVTAQSDVLQPDGIFLKRKRNRRLRSYRASVLPRSRLGSP